MQLLSKPNIAMLEQVREAVMEVVIWAHAPRMGHHSSKQALASTEQSASSASTICDKDAWRRGPRMRLAVVVDYVVDVTKMIVVEDACYVGSSGQGSSSNCGPYVEAFIDRMESQLEHMLSEDDTLTRAPRNQPSDDSKMGYTTDGTRYPCRDPPVLKLERALSDDWIDSLEPEMQADDTKAQHTAVSKSAKHRENAALSVEGNASRRPAHKRSHPDSSSTCTET